MNRFAAVFPLPSAIVAIASAGCSAGESSIPGADAVDVASQAIHGGAREYGFVAVGAVVADGRHCTGTLVTPGVILTAAHCVTPGGSGTFYTGHAYRHSPGADDFSGMHAHVVREFRVHPEASPRCGEGIDLAVGILETPTRGILPSHLRPEALPLVDEACISVGFGEHGDDAGVVSSGVKRSDVEHVTRVDAPHIHTRFGTGITAPGDSGGALFCGGWQIGVTSCGDGTTSSTYVAIPPLLEWIRATSKDDGRSGDGGRP